MTRLDQKSKPTTSLTPPAEEVSGTAQQGPPPDQGPIKSASQYSQRVMTRRGRSEGLKGKGKPLGGAPEIPEGKLAPIATAAKARVQVPDEEPPPINSEEAAAARGRAPPPHIPGVGSAFEVNQALARGEAGRDPISMGEAKRQGMGGRAKAMSPETLDALHHAKEQFDEAAAAEPGEVEGKLDQAEEDISQSNLPIDFEALMGARNALVSKERREAIEAKLEPLSIGDLIMKKEIQQRVDIVPGFWILLRTFTQKEHLYCLRKVNEFSGSPMYLEELLNTFKLVCCLMSMNDQVMPEHRKDVGQRSEDVDDEAFNEKLFAVSMYPVQVLADLSVQTNWFNERVQALFELDNLKNG